MPGVVYAILINYIHRLQHLLWMKVGVLLTHAAWHIRAQGLMLLSAFMASQVRFEAQFCSFQSFPVTPDSAINHKLCSRPPLPYGEPVC